MQGRSANAELFDPVSQTSRLIAMTAGRIGHSATLLPSGRVLIIGGGYGKAATLRSAEIFDPATEGFRPTASPLEGRTDHSAILLGTGKVLVLGGDVSGVGSTPTAGAELYDPATEAFVRTGSMITPRRTYGVVMLGNGSILVAGGTTTGKRVIADAETYDVPSGTFSRTGALSFAREKHTASVLRDGTVLLVGGSEQGPEAGRLTSSEIFDPETGRFSAGPKLTIPRHKVVSIALTNGSVLVVGGGAELAEVYNPTAKRFERIPGARNTERYYPAVAALGENRVMISGGYTSGGSKTSTWVYQP